MDAGKLEATLSRIRAVVEDTKLSPTAALDTIRAILEEE